MVAALQFARHRRRGPGTVGAQQLLQGGLDAGLALPGRQVQNPQILLGRPLRLLGHQPIIGQPKAARREQVVAVAVVGERARLADQPVDDVPVVDAVIAPAPQPGQTLDLPLGIPDLDVIGVQARFHPLADQPARHGVGVACDVDGAAGIDAHAQTLARLDPSRRQGPQQGQLLGQTGLAASVQLREQLPQEGFVVRPLAKVAAAAQHQGLVQGTLELAMALLGVAILVAGGRVGDLALQPIVPQQRLVALRERLPFFPGRDGGGQPIGAVPLRHAAQFPEGILQAVTETLQALAAADRAGLPVRVGEHEVKEQVRQGLAADRDLQAGTVGKVGSTELARFVALGEEHLLGRPVQRAPFLEAALERPELAVGEASGMASLQVGEQGFGLQSGIEAKHLVKLRPDVHEGIRPGAMVAVHRSDLTGQLAEPPVLAGGLGVDTRLGGGLFLGPGQQVEAAQTAHLCISDHPKPPCRKGLRIGYRAQLLGKSNCR